MRSHHLPLDSHRVRFEFSAFSGMEDLKSVKQHMAEEQQQPSFSKNIDKADVCAPYQAATSSPLLRRRGHTHGGALRLKMPSEILREDTMFTCSPCGKRFSSHSPLADHIRSKRHRGLDHPDTDNWVCFYCTCCDESLSLCQLQHHVGERPHTDLSLEKVLTWYKTQPYGLPTDEQTIVERHHRGIQKLQTALRSV